MSVTRFLLAALAATDMASWELMLLLAISVWSVDTGFSGLVDGSGGCSGAAGGDGSAFGEGSDVGVGGIDVE